MQESANDVASSKPDPLFSSTGKSVQQRPPFTDLPLQPHHPPYSAWGLWGDDDELGMLNSLTPTTTRSALREVETGKVIPLKYVVSTLFLARPLCQKI